MCSYIYDMNVLGANMGTTPCKESLSYCALHAHKNTWVYILKAVIFYLSALFSQILLNIKMIKEPTFSKQYEVICMFE